MKRHRTLSTFSLSFLDIMFCGFGAVVLLVLILNHDTVKVRRETQADLRAEVLHIEKQVVAQEKHLSETRIRLSSTRSELAAAERETAAATTTLENTRADLMRMKRDTRLRIEQIEMLKKGVTSLEGKNLDLKKQLEAQRESGAKTRRFLGEGDRQYLTGLKLGGKRILILLDASASMLDETLVNIIRLRNMDQGQRQNAKKWQRALAIVEWLVANLPRTSLFQIYSFNVKAESVIPGKQAQWLRADGAEILNQAIERLRTLVPGNGTSLHQAFSVAKKLQPGPDNIILITDGLPTQGRSKPSKRTVSAEQRLKHFQAAIKRLPKGLPVNTILLPMEGDAYAAGAFWQLARTTRGSFITPARDWP